MLRNSFDELQTSITEVEVEKWTRLVDSERMYAITNVMTGLMRPTVQQITAKESSEQDEKLRLMLHHLDQPIIQITTDVSALHDRFNSMS